MMPNKQQRAREILKQDGTWVAKGDKIYHRDWRPDHTPKKVYPKWIRLLVGLVYADQNISKSVRNALSSFIANQPPTAIGLNFGSGHTDLDDKVINLDVYDAPNIDIVNSGLSLPFEDESVDFVITQEVIEHVSDPFFTIQEIGRVLKTGGACYCQLPFQIGFHPGPTDFWRFTRQGIAQLFAGEEWSIIALEQSLGHGSGAYRIGVEFFAVTASCIISKLYLPTKGIASILLWPLKLLDLVTHRSNEADRIPGGYWIIVKKVKTQN